jgi:hypothetical protein
MTDLSTDFESYRISQSSASLRLGIIEWDLQAVRFHELHTTVDVFIPSVDRFQSTYAVNHVISKTHLSQRQGTMAENLQAEP